MPTRPILIRVAVALVLMAAFVVLADGVAQHELGEAMGAVTGASIVADAQPPDAPDDE